MPHSSSSSKHHSHYLRNLTSAHQYDNYSITTSVTIRVTPHDDYLVSWGVLWAFFVLATIVATYQVQREQRILNSRRQVDDVEQAAGMTGDGEVVSTADVTRGLFRRQLLLAMFTRVVMIPIQIWTDPIWWQFVGDTMPEMIFASAWTTLVSFIVQLVGIAMGTGTNTSPGIVIQTTAYVVYGFLVTVQFWNDVATVLLYALMCCIYAALFGTTVYFCPRLLTLLQPSLVRHRGLAVRIIVVTILCMAVFLAHAIGYARLVVAPPREVYWWWKYGILELVPAVIFLSIMGTSSNKAARNGLDHDDESVVAAPISKGIGGFKRVDSVDDSSNAGKKREAAPLLKGSAETYGATETHSHS